jgi:hypothetical protein
LFKGASIQFKDTKNADEIAAKVAELPTIKRIFPVRRYPVPQHTVHSTGDAVSDLVSKRGKGSKGHKDKDTFTPHLMTQVNKFRDAGIKGKGIKIGIIDTGVSFWWGVGAFQAARPRGQDVSLTQSTD